MLTNAHTVKLVELSQHCVAVCQMVVAEKSTYNNVRLW